MAPALDYREKNYTNISPASVKALTCIIINIFLAFLSQLLILAFTSMSLAVFQIADECE